MESVPVLKAEPSSEDSMSPPIEVITGNSSKFFGGGVRRKKCTVDFTSFFGKPKVLFISRESESVTKIIGHGHTKKEDEKFGFVYNNQGDEAFIEVVVDPVSVTNFGEVSNVVFEPEPRGITRGTQVEEEYLEKMETEGVTDVNTKVVDVVDGDVKSIIETVEKKETVRVDPESVTKIMGNEEYTSEQKIENQCGTGNEITLLNVELETCATQKTRCTQSLELDWVSFYM